jgi:hypothetical protein
MVVCSLECHQLLSLIILHHTVAAMLLEAKLDCQCPFFFKSDYADMDFVFCADLGTMGLGS